MADLEFRGFTQTLEPNYFIFMEKCNEYCVIFGKCTPLAKFDILFQIFPASAPEETVIKFPHYQPIATLSHGSERFLTAYMESVSYMIPHRLFHAGVG